MYRKIFTPSEQNSNIPIVIPRTWYGQPVEVIVFPVFEGVEITPQDLAVQERRKKREELDRILNEYPLDLSNFKFNRDEANDYD